jgi:membrane-bound lytic murein transglycosylase A
VRLGGIAIALATLALTACASTPPVSSPPAGPSPHRPPVVVQPPASPAPSVTLELSALPGWDQDDHAAALAAFQQTCHVAKAANLADACRRARAMGALGRDDARRYLEANFRAAPSPPAGLLTAYFSPEYEARFSRQGEFTAPLRPRPADLVEGQPYADRATIEASPEARPLAWMKAEDLFFLQIQGSGTLRLPDGRRLRATYDGTNSQPFVGIAAPMRDQGLLANNNTSGQSIRQWLADHRGAQADAVMQLNPRFVFFRTSPDDGQEPAGAAGVPLPAGRSIAVDLGRHAVGEPFWIEASAPTLAGAFPSYRRFVMALDTGGAIKGDVRADLYMGRGDAAGAEAGRVKHTLRMYRLIPVVR